MPAQTTPAGKDQSTQQGGGGSTTQSTTQATTDAADGAKDTKADKDKAKDKPGGGGGGGSAATSTARKGVLLIGDSLTVGVKPYFTEQLAGQPVQVDATSGISLAEGMRRYHAAKDKPRVVEMALFTNNSPGQKDELRKAIEETIADAKARGGKVVWATIVRPGDYGAVNDMIRDYAAKNPGVMEVVDWAKMVQQHPGYVGGDGVHSGAEGYKARAQAFAAAAK
jgi:lysophospholipase L1-like esterase